MVFLFTVTSCKHYYYVPTVQNVPLFKEKNEYRATVAVGGGDETSTTDIQSAYSVTDKFAVMANFMTAKGGDKSSNNWGEGKYFDAALGYFKPLDMHGVFEIYGGVGSSNQHHQYQRTSSSWNGGSTTYNSGTADLSFTKLFLQPSLGLTFNGFDIALTSGISQLNFHKINNQIDTIDIEYFVVDTISKNRTSFLFEPSLTIRGGWKYVKLQIQLLSSKNLSRANLKFNDSKISIGLTFAFADRFRRKTISKTVTGTEDKN